MLLRTTLQKLSPSFIGACRSHISTKRILEASRVLILGSGGLSIGQAGEFDYSGSQAIKALKEESVHTILINPNIATVQTSKGLADSVYFLPVTPDYVASVIEKEKPDGILLTFGGQTALNCGIALHESGILKKHNVKVLGTPVETLIASEDRDMFAKGLTEIGIPIAKSIAVETVPDALAAAETLGYPVIIRSAYALGGLGSGFASTPEELNSLASNSLAFTSQILVEKSMKGWKEVEYEVMRDAANNCITVCNMENFDPLGVHTGDSIVVAPSQTLSDEEYHMLRTASIKIVRYFGVVGECNVQFALNPHSLEYAVIEMNARLSRSSALASKATGYPLAFVAAKVGLGYNLPEISNSITKTTTAFFEPSLDYIVTKIPKWEMSKFNHADPKIGSSMKSVGESMAIGRTFEESLQKAIRQIGYDGFEPLKFDDIDAELKSPTHLRLFAIANAMIKKNHDVEKIHELTKIDRWFLHKLENIKEIRNNLTKSKVSNRENLLEAKKAGFSDNQVAKLVNSTEDSIRQLRKQQGITPFVKQIDTLAGEVPTTTNYLYTTYNATADDIKFDDHGVMVLGSGSYRIGSSVEFDWCAVNCVDTIRNNGYKTICVNYNPETVSTDYDQVDRLYFEELSYERVMDIYEKELASGIVVSMGGQLPQNIALRLYENGANIYGTSPVDIDRAENRAVFSEILDKAGIGQPRWNALTNLDEALEFANTVGYPCLVRPSYVLSGAAMNVAFNEHELQNYLSMAKEISSKYPVVISKFIENSKEVDLDCVARNGQLLAIAVSEHLENAGIHSGDASLALPALTLTTNQTTRLKDISSSIAKQLKITGPFNMQVILTPEGQMKVIECNVRASRSFPFVSKVLDCNFIELATKAMLNLKLEHVNLNHEYSYQAVKVSQFSWPRLPGADPVLGVEMASTGEIACLGNSIEEAYYRAIQSVNGFKLPLPHSSILLVIEQSQMKPETVAAVRKFSQLGYALVTADQVTHTILDEFGVKTEKLELSSIDFKSVTEALKRKSVSLALSLSGARRSSITDETYILRRSAVNMGIPIIHDSTCASILAEGIKIYGMKELSEPKSWQEYLARNSVQKSAKLQSCLE